MARTQTEIQGFAENVRKNLQKIRSEMKRAGYSPDDIDAILKEKIERVAALKARQGELQRDTLGVSAELRAESRSLDWSASGYLDAGMGAVGKGSDAAKNLQRLRSRIRMPAAPEPSATDAASQEAED